jgi:hypothetical protein
MKKLIKNFALTVFIVLLFTTAFFGGKALGHFAYYPLFSKQATVNTEPVKNQVTSSNAKPTITKAVSETTTYTNENYGFSLEMTRNWQDYKAEEELLGGVFNIAEVYFMLENQKLFSLSVFLKESWEEPERDRSKDDLFGEKIGENDTYVFLYSHINGDPPKNVSVLAIQDMSKIASSIKTFAPTNFEPDKNEATENELELLATDYRNNSINYWNCSYRYSLYYPSSFTNNDATFESSKAVFSGTNIFASVEAHTSSETLTDFADNTVTRIGGEIVDTRNKERYGTKIIAYEMTNPDMALIFWQEEQNIMEFRIWGSEYINNQDIVQNMITTLEFNVDNSNCRDF